MKNEEFLVDVTEILRVAQDDTMEVLSFEL